ncbi:DUF2974 domain-containing protein [Treponema parvum]|uniref:DUF2974 domain-containing protein n=1 Tax=Treponema parvum TaxID=138851 RepID=A0A975EZV9_9SPIR|nr:Mbeg1-like protein [Treponema parvum]QTQ12020.1 DUF2974 domain-containing protein [Treponema parvum]QTQ16003.1 DUF2974 domain-containing protein [Treponema parvum]
MADLIDYVRWRGDLTISVSPFNEVDALVLSQLVYLDYTEIVSSGFSKKISVSRLAEDFKKSPDYNIRSNTGQFINPKTAALLEACGASLRFGNMEVCGFINKIDLENEEQFSAFTVLLNRKTALAVFRGTDDTIVGWKEDFNMGFKDVIPSQLDAAVYIEKIFKKGGIRSCGKLYLSGHSKGGNLAMYAASFVPQKIKNKIKNVYIFDAPGLNEKLAASGEFFSIKDILRSFYPQFSIIGMLFNHPEDYTIVESGQAGIMQHDPFSWHMERNNFIKAPDFENFSKYVQKTLNTWFLGLSLERREKFVETIFKVLRAAEARTNTEFYENWLKNSALIIKALAGLDAESRKETVEIIRLLFKTAASEMPDILKPLKK